jgi:hypothetical protein
LLADGRVIPADYRTFTHGYAVTSHAAQGKTVDEVLLVASSRSLPAINQEQFYVSISRGRERCQIFTDDSDLLRSHVTRSSARLAAVEAMPQRDFLQTILQRGNRFLKRFRQRIAQSLSIETTERSSHEIKPTRTPANNPPAISASSPRDNPCLGTIPIAALAVLTDDGISYLLPYAQFLYAERTANPALEKEPEAPPEKMSIHFATCRGGRSGQRSQTAGTAGFRNTN